MYKLAQRNMFFSEVMKMDLAPFANKLFMYWKKKELAIIEPNTTVSINNEYIHKCLMILREILSFYGSKPSYFIFFCIHGNDNV